MLVSYLIPYRVASINDDGSSPFRKLEPMYRAAVVQHSGTRRRGGCEGEGPSPVEFFGVPEVCCSSHGGLRQGICLHAVLIGAGSESVAKVSGTANDPLSIFPTDVAHRDGEPSGAPTKSLSRPSALVSFAVRRPHFRGRPRALWRTVLFWASIRAAKLRRFLLQVANLRT